MATLQDHGPFSTELFFEPLLVKPLAVPAQDSYATIDKDAFLLDDRLDLAYKTNHDFDLPLLSEIDLPRFAQFGPLPDFAPQKPVFDPRTPDVWSLSYNDTSIEHLSSLRTHRLNLASPRQDTQSLTKPAAAAQSITILRALEEEIFALRQFIARVQRHKSAGQIHVALAACVSDIHGGLETLITDSTESGPIPDVEDTRSMLVDLLEVLQACEKGNDGDVLDYLRAAARSEEYASRATAPVLDLILQRACVPVVEGVLERVGLHPNRVCTVVSGEDGTAAGSIGQSGHVLSVQDRALVDDARHALEQLRRLEPRHPLVQPHLYGLVLEEGVTALNTYTGELTQYDDRVRDALYKYHACVDISGGIQVPHSSGLDDGSAELLLWSSSARQQDALTSLADRLNQRPTAGSGSGSFIEQLKHALRPRTSQAQSNRGETDSIIEAHLPLIRLQAQHINIALTRSLFETCNVLRHLEHLRSKFFLTDGIFLQRLSYVIFNDHTAATSEIEVPGSKDLAFDAREAQLYLPSGSKTRLALEDILTASNSTTTNIHERIPAAWQPAIGFSTQTLSPQHLSRLVDDGMVHTLELLSLKYKPPTLVDCVITEPILRQYDDVFRYLLRVRRVMLLVQQAKTRALWYGRRSRCNHQETAMPKNSRPDLTVQRFVVEAHFVALTLSAYANAAIERTWKSFVLQMHAVEREYSNFLSAAAAAAPTPESACSGQENSPGLVCSTIDDIRNMHTHALDELQARLFMEPEPDSSPDSHPHPGSNDLEANPSPAAHLSRCLSLIVKGCTLILAFEEGTAEYGAQMETLRLLHSELHDVVHGLVSMARPAAAAPTSHTGRTDADGMDLDDHDEAHGRDQDRAETAPRHPAARLAEMLDYNGFYAT